MTKKQKEKLLLLEYFIPLAVSSKSGSIGDTSNILESSGGIDSDEAFMQYQSNGIKPTVVKDLLRFKQLKSAQATMAMSEKMWREDMGKYISLAELKERDGSFKSDEQYKVFVKWVDKIFSGTVFADSEGLMLPDNFIDSGNV